MYDIIILSTLSASKGEFNVRKTISIFIVLCILTTVFVPVFAAGQTADLPKKISGTFKSSSKTFIGETSFLYDENDFSDSAYVYRHSLSKMSLRLALAAFSDKSDGYEKQYKNALDLMGKLGFNNIFHNKSYEEKPTTNSVGVIVGNKKIQFENGEHTLIAVAIRGGEYEAEWGGNFNIGDGELHEGFKIARDEVLAFLSDYVKKNDISGDIKIWITGYSRGAAVTNLIAAYLDDNTMFFGENVNLTPENIYSYCFESPSTVKNLKKKDVYNNIFNILNRRDIVTMLPLEKWDYSRYGKIYYLPSAETNIDYPELESRMYNVYRTYISEELKSATLSPRPFYECSFSWSSTDGVYLIGKQSTDLSRTEKYLNEITDELARVYVSPESYTKNHQDAFVSFGECIIGEGKTAEFFETFINELSGSFTSSDVASIALSIMFGGSIGDIIKNNFHSAIDSAALKMDIPINDDVADTLYVMSENLMSGHRLENLIGNIELLSEGHYPELCLAWLDTTDDSCYTDENKQLLVKVVLNGNRILFDQQPIIENGRTLVPLRKIFEALGASVEWDQNTKTVTSVKDDTKIVLTIGDSIMYVNGNPVKLDVPGKIVNNRTLVPARAVAEGFNCNVDWDNDTRTVIIAK